MDETVRWTVTVSKSTDIALRSHLAQQGMKKGDISKFVEEAVKWRVLDRTLTHARTRVADVPPEELQAAIDEACNAVRAQMWGAPSTKRKRK
jgi:3-oxoacyl-[acyl-carrier-protein] synthase III